MNISELPQVLEYSNKNGIRQINVAHQKIFTSVQRALSLFNEPAMAKSAFQTAEKMAEASGIKLNLPTLEPGPHPCHQPFEMLFIRWDGEVMGCCSAIFPGHPYRFSLGNLDDDEIGSLWNCDRIKTYRRAIIHGNVDFPT